MSVAVPKLFEIVKEKITPAPLLKNNPNTELKFYDSILPLLDIIGEHSPIIKSKRRMRDAAILRTLRSSFLSCFSIKN